MIVKKQPKAAAKTALTGAVSGSSLGRDPYYFTVKELKQMCENQGISTKYCRIKDDYINAFFGHEKQTGFTMVVKPHKS